MWTLDYVDLRILTFIALENKVTRYKITPHGKTNKKTQIKNRKRPLAPSSAKLRLERLERNGYIYSETEKVGSRRKFYKLTITGFLSVLANNDLKENSLALEQIVENCGHIVKYRTLSHKKIKTRSGTKLKRIVDYNTIIPLIHNEAFREDMGEKLYFESLVFASRVVYLDVISNRMENRLHIKPEGGIVTLPGIRKEHEQTLEEYIPLYEEEKLAHKFELTFLGDIFARFRPNLSKIVSSSFPHPELYTEVKALLENEIRDINAKKDRLETILRKSLKHFNPDAAPKIVTFPDEETDEDKLTLRRYSIHS